MKTLGQHWATWDPKDGNGLGYSYDNGATKADVGRALNPATGLIEWYAKVWQSNRISDARTTFTGGELYAAVAVVVA